MVNGKKMNKKKLPNSPCIEEILRRFEELERRVKGLEAVEESRWVKGIELLKSKNRERRDNYETVHESSF